MQDDDGFVIEGTMSNLFIEKDKKWFTPKLDRAGVKGVMRQWIMRNSFHAEIECEEKSIHLQEIKNADAIFICNSVIGIWPVNYIDDKKYDISDSIKCLMNVAHQNLTPLYPSVK